MQIVQDMFLHKTLFIGTMSINHPVIILTKTE